MLDNTGGGGKTNNVRQYRVGERQTLLDNTGGGERQTMLDNTGEGERQTMLDNTGGGGKTNNVRQYRGRGKDKQC